MAFCGQNLARLLLLLSLALSSSVAMGQRNERETSGRGGETSGGGTDGKTEVIRYAKSVTVALELLNVKLPPGLSMSDIRSLVQHNAAKNMRLVVESAPTVERNGKSVALRNDRPESNQFVCRGQINVSQRLWPQINDPDTEFALVYHEILGLCGFQDEEVYHDEFLATLKAFPHLRHMALTGDIKQLPQSHPAQDDLVSFMRLAFISAERYQIKLSSMLSYRTLEGIVTYESSIPFVFPFEKLEIRGQVALAHVRRKQEAIDLNVSTWSKLTPEQKLSEALGILIRYVSSQNSQYYVRAMAAAIRLNPAQLEQAASTRHLPADKSEILCVDFKHSVSRDGKPDPFFQALIESEVEFRARLLDPNIPEQKAVLQQVTDVGLQDVTAMISNWMHLRCLYRPADRFVDVICSSMAEHGQLLLRSSYSQFADPSIHPMLMQVPRTCAQTGRAQ